MTRHFAIGCVRGGSYVFIAGQILSLVAQISSGSVKFLWLNLALLGCNWLCTWMGYTLEKEQP